MARLFHRDNLVVITSGTLTVGSTTYPISGITSFNVSQSGKEFRDWPKSFQMFVRWLLGFTALAVVAWFGLLDDFLPFRALYVLLGVVVLGAVYAVWRGEYYYVVIDRWGLSINTATGRQTAVSSSDQSYIRNVASKLGQAMAHR